MTRSHRDRIVGVAPAAWVALLLAAPVCWAGAAHPAGDPAPALELTRKSLRSAKGVAIEAEAGRLLVRENRSSASSRSIAIGFLRLKSRSPSRAPLFYLTGGPGSRAVSESPGSLDFWAPLLAHHDVVLIDQRGTNDSLLVWHWDGPPPLGYFVHVDSALHHLQRMGARALQAFRARRVDLAGYTTVESAADLDELRAALGLERISLLGFSYGTHLSIAYLRRFGDRVESAVLLGTEGPDDTMKLPWTMDTQLQRLALLAKLDPALSGKVPDLVVLYDRVMARLARQPMVVTVPAGRDTLRVPIGPFGLRYILRADIGDATDLVVFPRLLWSIDQGDASALTWFVRKRAGGALGIHGMNVAMDEASGVSNARLKMIEEQARTSRFADVANFPHPGPWADWKIPDLGEPFRAPLLSSVRTLFISGELDCNTPPHQAEALRWGMTDATHLMVANAGHEQTFFQNDTAMPVVADFLAGKDVRDRKISYPPLRFVPLEGSDPRVTHPSVAR